MSTTVTYKGATLTIVNNQTRTLNTQGKYLEDNITLVDVTQGGGIDGDNIAYGNPVPAIVGTAIVGLSLVGEQTQPIVGTALAGLTVIGE